MNFDLFDQLADLLSPKPVKKPPAASVTRISKAESEHSIALDGRRVDYKIVRRRGRRGVGLKVDGSGLTVAASLTTPLSAIEGMIDQHAQWVTKKLGEWSQRRIVPQRWETGATLSVLGETVTLMIDVGHRRASVEPALSHLFVRVKTGDPNEVEKAVTTWMKKQALPHFAQRAFLFARLHQLTPPQVFLSSANGRWGSCNSRREVRFSWRLIKARPALIDYVVCHELAHLRHMNHSAAFWAEVRRMCPEFELLKKELDQHDHHFRAF
ncbi:MAG: M48 family metallopeptidase [Aeromicrobium sp.]|nr:M48 family metallopeptidase [Burkholderiales bacterium]